MLLVWELNLSGLGIDFRWFENWDIFEFQTFFKKAAPPPPPLTKLSKPQPQLNTTPRQPQLMLGLI